MTEKWTPEELKLNSSNKRQPLCKRTGKGSKAKSEIEMALKLNSSTNFKFYTNVK